MKKRDLYKSYLLGVLAVSLVTPVSSWAGDIVKRNGEYKIENSCNLGEFQKFHVLVNNSKVTSDAIKASPEGCVAYAIAGSSLKSGDTVTIVDTQGNEKDSMTVPQSNDYGGNSNRHGNHNNNGNSANDNRNDQLQDQKDKQRMETELALTASERAARYFADRVVEVYGDVENFRYNFHAGLKQELNEQIILEYSLNKIIYENSVSTGARDGSEKGYLDGTKVGFERGKSTGSAEAKSRFRQAVNSESQPDLTVPQYGLRGGVLKPNVEKPTLEKVLKEHQNELRRRFSERQWNTYGSYRLGTEFFRDDSWSLDSFYHKDYSSSQLTRGFYRGERALGLWKDRDLGIPFTRNMKAYNSLGYAAKQTFDRKFMEVYDGVIDRKWHNRVSVANFTAYREGSDMGTYVRAKFHEQKGHYDGYVRAYEQASIDGMSETWNEGLLEGFNLVVRNYQNEVVIDDNNLDMRLVDSANGSSVILPGAEVSLEIHKLQNMGGGTDPNLGVYVNGKLADSVNVNYSYSSNQSPFVITKVFTVPTDVKVGQHVVEIKLGEGVAKRLQFEVSFYSVLEKLSSEPENKNLQSYIVKVITDEWLAKRSDLGFYKKRLNQSILGELISYIKVNNEQGAFKSVLDEIKSSDEMKDKPGRLSPFRRGNWKNAMKAIKSVM